MEHFKSTIATTALLVAGLITAAQVLHPRDPASEMRRGASIATASAEATTWSDPPARAPQVVAALPDDPSSATGTVGAQAPRPASFTLLPAAMLTSLAGGETPLQPVRARRAEAGRGHKLVQAGNRSRSASIGQGSAAEPAAAKGDDANAQPGRAAQNDPIGDLLRGLGIGRDSEG